MRKLILLISFAAFACNTPVPGSGPGPGPGPGSDAAPPGNDQGLTMLSEELKNGSRLHNKLVNGEDGSQSLIGLYDTLLQEDCAFALAEDNQQRCLPTRVAGINTQYYYDAACTKPVAISDSCLPAVKYARTVDPACIKQQRIVAVSEITPPANIYISIGTCSPTPPMPIYRYYTVGASVPASQFVAGSYTKN